MKAHLARHYATSHNLAVRTGSPRPIMKTRTAFYLHATFLTKASRRLCQSHVPPRHIARSPFYPINIHAFKTECKFYLGGLYSKVEVPILKNCHRCSKTLWQKREEETVFSISYDGGKIPFFHFEKISFLLVYNIGNVEKNQLSL